MKETQNIEWKESWRDDYLKWICGFANAEGGVIHLGRDDDGKVVGVAGAERLLEEIPNKVRDVLGIMVGVNLRHEDGLEYVEIVTEPHPYPVSCRGRYFLRSGSTKQELKGQSLDRFLLRKQGRHWDGVPVPGVAAVDLSGEALTRFRELTLLAGRVEARDVDLGDAALVEKLHLDSGQYLKRAAVLLFHPDPERFVGGASLKIGFFDERGELRYQDEVRGNLFVQVEKALEVLGSKYLKGNIRYVGAQRIERPEIPPEALREALLNALAHKDYASAAPIQVRVSEAKLSIWNPGTLPDGWTVERLLDEHPSRPFNPDIANVFFRAGLIESWGQGIERMRQACRKAEVPEPGFKLEPDGFRVDFSRGDAGETRRKASGKTSGKTSGKIVELIRGNRAITIPEMAELLFVTERSVERHLKKLQERGTVSRVGPAKGGHWEIIDHE